VRHIVLDAEVFRRENLAFDSVRFQRLAELVDEDEVEVHLTDIVYEEVRRAIAEQVRVGFQTLREEPIRRALNVIAHGGVPKLKELLRQIDESEIVATLMKEFDQLLDRLNTNVIVTDDVPMKEVRERYFRTTPPFGHRANKKHEFPDAISAVAIQLWAATQTETVVVVSSDAGIAAAVQGVQGVQHVKELRSVIDFILRRMAIVDDPDALLKAKEVEIKERVKEHFEGMGFYVDGEWGEVVEATVRSIDMGTAYLGDRKGDLVTLAFEAEIRYVAQLSFDDPDRTAYDSETGDTYVFGSFEKTVRDSAYLEGEVEIEIDADDLSRSQVKAVFLPAKDIGVPAPGEPNYK